LEPDLSVRWVLVKHGAAQNPTSLSNAYASIDAMNLEVANIPPATTAPAGIRKSITFQGDTVLRREDLTPPSSGFLTEHEVYILGKAWEEGITGITSLIAPQERAFAQWTRTEALQAQAILMQCGATDTPSTPYETVDWRNLAMDWKETYRPAGDSRPHVSDRDLAKIFVRQIQENVDFHSCGRSDQLKAKRMERCFHMVAPTVARGKALKEHQTREAWDRANPQATPTAPRRLSLTTWAMEQSHEVPEGNPAHRNPWDLAFPGLPLTPELHNVLKSLVDQNDSEQVCQRMCAATSAEEFHSRLSLTQLLSSLIRASPTRMVVAQRNNRSADQLEETSSIQLIPTPALTAASRYGISDRRDLRSFSNSTMFGSNALGDPPERKWQKVVARLFDSVFTPILRRQGFLCDASL
jgi:hypothetical protein